MASCTPTDISVFIHPDPAYPTPQHPGIHPGVHCRHSPSWVWGSLLFDLVVGLIIAQVMLVLKVTWNCGVREASIKISKESLGDQEICSKARIPGGSP